MPRPSRKVWALLLFMFAGCSLVTDFDRDRLGASPDEQDEAGATTPGSRMDAQVGPHTDAQVTPGVDGSIVEDDAGAGVACQTHANCGRNQLCCGGSCIATNDAHCADCEQGCSLGAANQWNDRVCGCGAAPACAADKPYCQGSGATSTCVACRDASDCEKTGGAAKQCIQGTCAACNPADNSGCSGNTPICNPTTFVCEACKASPDNCPGSTSVCTPSGACGGCTANDMADCTNPTAPICNLTSNPTMCRGCMSDGECMTEWNRPYCVNNQRCSTCRPSDDMGCVATSATPDCRPNAQGVYTCQGCQADSCGTGLRCNTQTGKCVACRNDSDCDTNSATPYCDPTSGTCRGCTAVGSQNASNLWCTANTLLARQVCNTSGRCVRCDATNSTACSENTPRCLVDTAAPQNNACVGCRPGMAGDCGGATPICDASTRRCRGCTMATEAQDCPQSGATPICDATTGRCVACTATRGCRGASGSCLVMPDSSMNTCVDCTGTVSGECTGNTPVCDTARRTCVPCLTQGNAGCSNGRICLAGATTTMNRCVECTSAEQCRNATGCQMAMCSDNVCSYPGRSTEDGFSCTTGACVNGTIVQTPDNTVCRTPCNLAVCVGAGGAAGTGCGPVVPVMCPGMATCDPQTGCPPVVPAAL